jgi:hypothetical protein
VNRRKQSSCEKGSLWNCPQQSSLPDINGGVNSLGVDNGDLYPDEQVMAEVTVCHLQDDRLWLVLGMFSFLFPLIDYPWRIKVWTRGVRISCSPTLSSSHTLLASRACSPYSHGSCFWLFTASCLRWFQPLWCLLPTQTDVILVVWASYSFSPSSLWEPFSQLPNVLAWSFEYSFRYQHP